MKLFQYKNINFLLLREKWKTLFSLQISRLFLRESEISEYFNQLSPAGLFLSLYYLKASLYAWPSWGKFLSSNTNKMGSGESRASDKMRLTAVPEEDRNLEIGFCSEQFRVRISMFVKLFGSHSKMKLKENSD